VKNALSRNSLGRSSGVTVAEFQMPSKFGRPPPVFCPETSADPATSAPTLAITHSERRLTATMQL
jgi:hypothetical protein